MRKIIVVVLSLLLWGTVSFSQEQDDTSLAELNEQLDNPRQVSVECNWRMCNTEG